MNTADWESVDPTTLGDLEPVQTLIEYECQPLVYVALDVGEGILYLHWLTDEDGTDWYSVSGIDADILDDLKASRIDLRSAINRPKCWIAGWRRFGDGKPSALYRVTFGQIPDDCLPKAGVRLNP